MKTVKIEPSIKNNDSNKETRIKKIVTSCNGVTAYIQEDVNRKSLLVIKNNIFQQELDYSECYQGANVDNLNLNFALSDNGEVLVTIGKIKIHNRISLAIRLYDVNSSYLFLSAEYSIPIENDVIYQASIDIDNLGNNIIIAYNDGSLIGKTNIYTLTKLIHTYVLKNVTDDFTFATKTYPVPIKMSGDGNVVLLSSSDTKNNLLIFSIYKKVSDTFIFVRIINVELKSTSYLTFPHPVMSVNYDGSCLVLGSNFDSLNIPNDFIGRLVFIKLSKGLVYIEKEVPIITDRHFKYEYFGNLCYINDIGNKVLVSSHRCRNTSNNNGSIFLFEINNDEAIQQNMFIASDENYDTFFGKVFSADKNFTYMTIIGNRANVYNATL